MSSTARALPPPPCASAVERKTRGSHPAPRCTRETVSASSTRHGRIHPALSASSTRSPSSSASAAAAALTSLRPSSSTRRSHATRPRATGAEAASAEEPPSAGNSVAQLLASLRSRIAAVRSDPELRSQLERVNRVRGELVPMSLLFFSMASINTFLDSTKDVLVVTMSGGGAEVLPFLVPYGVLPASMIFVLLYTFMSIHLSRRALFNIIVVCFTLYFCLFTAVLFPMRDTLNADILADWLRISVPPSLGGLVAMVRTWVYTVFYIVSELWGDVILSLLFWGLANERTSVQDAHIMYPLLGFGANVAQSVSGQIMKLLSGMAYHESVTAMMSLCIGLCGAILGVHQYIVSSDAKAARNLPLMAAVAQAQAGVVEAPLPVAPKAKKEKLTFTGALKFLATQQQIRCLATMAICQGMASNLLEVTWKGHLRLLHESPTAYSSFMGDVATFTGVATMGMMMMAPFLFSRFGWAKAAAFTPKLLIYGGIPFFAGCTAHMLGFHIFTKSLMLYGLVLLGAGCMIFSRAAKFSLFKPAEEMVYIMLDNESRTKGKAAVDVMGSQMGKALGSCLQQVLLLVGGGSLFNVVPVMAVVFVLALQQWIASVRYLAKFHVANTEKAGSQDASLDDDALINKVGPACAVGDTGPEGPSVPFTERSLT